RSAAASRPRARGSGRLRPGPGPGRQRRGTALPRAPEGGAHHLARCTTAAAPWPSICPADALPYRRFRALLLSGLPRALGPEPQRPGLEGLHDRGELHLLRLVEPAIHLLVGGRHRCRAAGRDRDLAPGGPAPPDVGD